MTLEEARRRIDEIDVQISAHEASIVKLRQQRADYHRTLERLQAEAIARAGR